MKINNVAISCICVMICFAIMPNSIASLDPPGEITRKATASPVSFEYDPLVANELSHVDCFRVKKGAERMASNLNYVWSEKVVPMYTKFKVSAWKWVDDATDIFGVNNLGDIKII